MTGPLYRYGGLVARWAPWVIVGSLAFVIVIILVANSVGRPTSNNTTIPGSDSEKATELLEKKLPAQANGTVPIVLEATKGTALTDATNVTAINDAVDSLTNNSTAYVASWLKALRDNKKLVVLAAAQAHRAADHILDRSFEEALEAKAA